MSTKKKNQLPKGWTLKDVQDVAAYYQRQSENEGAQEIEDSPLAEAVVIVPAELVPQVRKLIADKAHRKARGTRSRRVA
jgi:hypothetical protein